MKKMKYYLVLIAIFSLVLVGCGNAELFTDKVKAEKTEVASLKTDQSVMLFSTLSSANILSEEVNKITSLSMNKPMFGESGQAEIEVDMEKANSYLLMMENILADGGPIVTSESESDREGYDYMMIITVKDLAGNESLYTIYYSIVVDGEVPGVNDETNADLKEPAYRRDWDDDDDDDDDDERDDRDEYDAYHEKAKEQFKHHERKDKEDEVEYQINALAVIDGVEYQVVGKKEVEIDDNETEVEIEFVVKLDDENYVRIEQETEEDETEYKYVVYKNKKKQLSMSFESEVENGVTVIKLTTDENGYKETYKFMKKDNKTIIKYQGNGYSYTLYVTSTLDSETGEMVYEYKAYEKDFSWKYRKEHKKH